MTDTNDNRRYITIIDNLAKAAFVMDSDTDPHTRLAIFPFGAGPGDAKRDTALLAAAIFVHTIQERGLK